MKIVVTGALGHIGSRLVREIGAHTDEPEIVMIDNMLTQRYPSLFDMPKSSRYHFIEGDVTELDMGALVEGADAVIHLAAITDAAGSFDRKDMVEKNNYNGTEAVARACLANHVPLIYPSSTSVYGTQAKIVDENCTAEELQPQSPYAETKLREEALLAELSKTEGLRHVTLRLGTIFGTAPGMRFHTAVNKFCWQAIMGQPVTVWRTAMDQKRPYLDLGDAVRVIAGFINKGIFDGRVYNVLTINATVRDVVDTIKAFVPNLEVMYVDTKIMNQLSYEVACERVKETGFQAQGDMHNAISATLDLLSQANSSQVNDQGRLL